MIDASLISYISKTRSQGYSEEQIKQTLIQQGWSKTDIDTAFAHVANQTSNPLPPPPVPNKKSELSLDILHLDASQILLYLGSLIVFLAGVFFIGLNWQAWNTVSRIAAILVPMILMFTSGTFLWNSKNYRKQSIVLIFTGALLFPLFLIVSWRELHIISDTFDYNVGLAISFITLIVYIVLNFAFRYPIWPFLYTVSGIATYYFFLATTGIINSYSPSISAWAFLFLGVCYVLLGLYYEYVSKKKYSKYPYVFGFMMIFLSLQFLSISGNLLSFIPNNSSDQFNITRAGFSSITTGAIFIGISFLCAQFKKQKFEGIGEYIGFFNYIGTFGVLGGIFGLGAQGHKPHYELAHLITSLGFIFTSINAQSRAFLYIGTLHLVVFIFTVGGEYFQGLIGWPATLFFAGLFSMGVGFGITKLRQQYFVKTKN